MDINIVLDERGLIVPRMAGWLAEGNGWRVSDKPDDSADVNYFMPYLKAAESEPVDTKTAAWFTHRELGTPWKLQAWDDAKSIIDAPLVTAPLYCPYLDKAQVITPGVDRSFFHPRKVEKSERTIIGIAGVGQPRKGPKAIIDVMYSGIVADVVIVGRNWPFHHNFLTDEQMPDFYSYIDVYLCTSIIEGIPAPVLEALACDCKVVVPHGVGICSELPEMPGLRHYTVGNSKRMIAAIQQALADEPEPGSLRAVTERYSIDAWCESHMRAMEVLVNA